MNLFTLFICPISQPTNQLGCVIPSFIHQMVEWPLGFRSGVRSRTAVNVLAIVLKSGRWGRGSWGNENTCKEIIRKLNKPKTTEACYFRVQVKVKQRLQHSTFSSPGLLQQEQGRALKDIEWVGQARQAARQPGRLARICGLGRCDSNEVHSKCEWAGVFWVLCLCPFSLCVSFCLSVYAVCACVCV